MSARKPPRPLLICDGCTLTVDARQKASLRSDWGTAAIDATILSDQEAVAQFENAVATPKGAKSRK
jgi:hypothetical protein